MKNKNIVCSFIETGILPLNCPKFPENLFDPADLSRYKEDSKLYSVALCAKYQYVQ